MGAMRDGMLYDIIEKRNTRRSVRSTPMGNAKASSSRMSNSALNITENDNFKLLQHGNMIEILSAEDENSPVTVYDDMGRDVEHTNSHSILLDKKGVYILTVEGRHFKFIIKN